MLPRNLPFSASLWEVPEGYSPLALHFAKLIFIERRTHLDCGRNEPAHVLLHHLPGKPIRDFLVAPQICGVLKTARVALLVSPAKPVRDLSAGRGTWAA